MSLKALKAPGVKDFEIVRGDSFTRTLRITVGGVAEDLTGFTAAAHIRSYDQGPLLTTFAVVVEVPETDGKITITLTTTQTRTLPCDCVWDLQVVLTSDPPNNTHTIIKGKLKVPGDQTQV